MLLPFSIKYNSVDSSSTLQGIYAQHLHDSPETAYMRVICATIFRTTCSVSCKLIILVFWIFWVRRFDWFDLASFKLPSWKTRRDATRYFCQSFCCSCWLGCHLFYLLLCNLFFLFFYICPTEMIALITWRSQLIRAQKQHAHSACLAGQTNSPCCC